jgi:Ser/Thr protein kinase RdoA (MazF antagonist)
MAPKLEIATTSHSLEELAPIVSDYTSSRLLERKQLFGGYSGSNYRVDLEDGSTFVLKVTNGYTAEHAELMCRTAYHLGRNDYCCLPITRIRQSTSEDDEDDAATKNDDSAKFRFVSLNETHGVPAFLLTFVEGKQADQVMREQPHLATNVMRGIGGGLARMHAAASMTREKAQTIGLRWYEKDGGCCDVQDQVNGTVLASIDQCQEIQNHEFLPFYKKELSLLQSEMRLAKDMEMGITHGDPFADNVLVHCETGDLSAFIDIEDCCAGPLLFDLACCAIGCCFNESSSSAQEGTQVLDFQLLEALLDGYCSDRKLALVERDHFVAFMKLTLLCNCCWRFVKFNVQSSRDDVPEEARNSYLELQRRIEYLHDLGVAQKISAVLAKYS